MTHPLSEAGTSVGVKLEPCRRCGQRDAEVFANDGWFTVECNNCPCRTSGADRSAAEAIAAWNRRALIQPTPAETEGAPVTLRVSREWLRNKIETDADLETEARAMHPEAPPPIGDGEGQVTSPSDPKTILAGIAQFGLAGDGSDLRDLASSIAALSRQLEEAREALGKLVLLLDLFEASDRSHEDAFFMLAQQPTTWEAARSILRRAKETVSHG